MNPSLCPKCGKPALSSKSFNYGLTVGYTCRCGHGWVYTDPKDIPRVEAMRANIQAEQEKERRLSEMPPRRRGVSK